MKGLYIHIPFCVKKCPYCDFNSFDGQMGKSEDYFDALISHAKKYRGEHFDTVYIGGGTPTSVDPLLISRLISHVFAYFDISIDAEITIEANPATVTPESLALYRKSGINRISIGIQSFSDTVLHGLGRIHSAADAKRAITDAYSAGFENISIDLMFSVPLQTFTLWAYDLSYALTAPISHISCYGLKVEPGTPFARDSVAPFDEETDRKLYHYAIEFLKSHGFEQYEISNFSKPGMHSRHNLIYWTGGNYLGIGAGAHSYLQNTRFSNVKPIDDYIKYVDDSSKLHENITPLSDRDLLVEHVITGLRLTRGLDIDDVLRLADRQKIKAFLDGGFMKLRENRISFTTKGFDVSNYILSELI